MAGTHLNGGGFGEKPKLRHFATYASRVKEGELYGKVRCSNEEHYQKFWQL